MDDIVLLADSNLGVVYPTLATTDLRTSLSVCPSANIPSYNTPEIDVLDTVDSLR